MYGLIKGIRFERKFGGKDAKVQGLDCNDEFKNRHVPTK